MRALRTDLVSAKTATPPGCCCCSNAMNGLMRRGNFELMVGAAITGATPRAEFEDEASKCKNITDARYTDGEFKPEKQIADIEGLIKQPSSPTFSHVHILAIFLAGDSPAN